MRMFDIKLIISGSKNVYIITKINSDLVNFQLKSPEKKEAYGFTKILGSTIMFDCDNKKC